MSTGVFVLKDAETLVEMKSAAFGNENEFQRLLEDFPSLLAGALIDAASPRKWLLVKREMSVASQRASLEAINVGRKIADWMNDKSQVFFGTGSRDGSMNAVVMLPGIRLNVLSLWSHGKIMMNFGSITRDPVNDEETGKLWLERLNQIPGLHLQGDATSRWPTLPLMELAPESRLRLFLDASEWLLDRLKMSEPP